MDYDSCFKIGFVVRTHGLKGEVTIKTMPECPDLSSVGHVFIEHDGALVPYFVSSVASKADKAYISFEDVDTLEKASRLKGASIFLSKENRPTLKGGQFYNDEVIGFEVRHHDQVLGSIRDIQEAGGNRFIVLDYQTREILIPVAGPFIKTINRSARKITVELPEGFLDI